MKKITFVIPSRNNLEFLKLAYNSIKNLGNNHEVLVLDDASVDGTTEWLSTLNDDLLLVYRNEGPERIGIVGMFDAGIKIARTEIIMAFHADMVAGPELDVAILRHLEKGTVVSATRVEPPLHPEGLCKVTKNFGIEPEEFDFDVWNKWCTSDGFNEEYTGKVTSGIFAPWCMYKDDFERLGGHDELFAPQSREDSDLFNRFLLAGYKFKQPWDGVVYHFTSRGSRFNKHSGGSTGVDSPEWQKTNLKNEKNFIRKWGCFAMHDHYMLPILFPKYDIGIIAKNCNNQLIELLEPWCTTLYTDGNFNSYIQNQKSETLYDLNKRIFDIHSKVNNNIEIRIDGHKFSEVDYEIIKSISEIIQNQQEIGSFEIENMEVNINSLESTEKTLTTIIKKGN